jgi:hypothetical protein
MNNNNDFDNIGVSAVYENNFENIQKELSADAELGKIENLESGEMTPE